MFNTTMVPAWIVAEASNLNGTHVVPFHWLIRPVADAIQMSPVLGVAGTSTEMVVRVPPGFLMRDALGQHRRGDAAVQEQPAEAPPGAGGGGG